MQQRPWPWRGRVTLIAGWIPFSLALMIASRSPAMVDPPVEVGGGGSRATDCYATFKANVNVPLSRPRRVRCVDGDPSCDADATVDGVCSFAVAICANSTSDPDCTSAGVESLFVLHSQDDGVDPEFAPDLQSLQSRIETDIEAPTATADLCTTPATVHLRTLGPVRNNTCRQSRTTVTLITVPHAGGTLDRDTLRLVCVPADEAQNGCVPTTLFSGTFDRLEKQIFTQSCGVATCHDSETTAAELLLEGGAAYANLVNVTPTNGAAADLGWKRVTPGDAASSFLYHKITDDLGGDLGLRMPRPPRRRRLDPSLQEIIRLWIDAGAPSSGWVPGTD